MKRAVTVAGLSVAALVVATAVTAPALLRAPVERTFGSDLARQSEQGRRSDSRMTTPSSATTVPAPAAAARRHIDHDVADAVVGTYSRSVDSLSGRSSASGFSEVVMGDALQELRAQVLELKANGWTVKGVPRVRSVRVLSTSTRASTPTAKVEACVDSTSVRTVDDAGRTVLRNPHAALRALNLYDLAYRDGAWRIVKHGFPDDTRC